MAKLTFTVTEASDDILQQRAAIFDKLEAGTSKQPEVIRDVSAAEYREMRARGTHGFTVPPSHSHAQEVKVKSRDNHDLLLRVIRPESGEVKGVFLYLHPGALVYGSAAGQDKFLLALANAWSLTAVSVEYRLAPENAFPIPMNDCVDAALYALSSQGQATLGGPLRLLMGDSAGAYLAMWTAISLRDHHDIDVASRLQGILCSYGTFHPAGTPSVLTNSRNCIVSKEQLQRCNSAAFQEPSATEVSLLTADLRNLPPALFLCGTADIALDDSILLAVRYSLAGSRAELKLIPGAYHAFTLIPVGEVQKEGVGALIQFGKASLQV